MRSITIISFLLISIVVCGQTHVDLQRISNAIAIKEETNAWEWAKSYKNEYDLLISNSFLLYKKFVSSQDANNCSFTPSCSVYAIQAIKSEGVLTGLINFFDRFTRCNSLSPEKYELDPLTKLLIDPVRDIHFK